MYEVTFISDDFCEFSNRCYSTSYYTYIIIPTYIIMNCLHILKHLVLTIDKRYSKVPVP